MARQEPRFPGRRLVAMIHLDLIRQHGGSPGLRDEGLLESALARPAMRFAYEAKADLADLAASLAYGLAKNHPFVDGNKRVALALLFTFLGMNDRELAASERDAVTTILAVASGKLDETGFADWIRQHSKTAPRAAR
ncbi:MAG: type II toxin-antitoxin system death-on-curing family toxin [Thermoanaerobaculia bacterium]